MNGGYEIVDYLSLDPAEQNLASRSIDARQNAYCPYSRVAVGVALLCKNGTIFTGCNVENASYPVGTCAEKTAICKAVSEGHRQFDRIAIASELPDATSPKSSLPTASQDNSEKFVTPCGSCRQVMAEFARDMQVLVVKADKSRVIRTSVAYLLPLSFSF